MIRVHSLLVLLMSFGCGELLSLDQDSGAKDASDDAEMDSSLPAMDSSSPDMDSALGDAEIADTSSGPELCTAAPSPWPDMLADGVDDDMDGRVDEGCGIFSVAWVESETDMIETSSVDAFDFDGDGWVDLTWMAKGSLTPDLEQHKFYRATGPFTFERVFVEQFEELTQSSADGRWLDLLALPGPEFVVSRAGPNEVWNLFGDVFGRQWESTVEQSHGRLVAADFDRDGHVDLVFTSWGGAGPLDTEAYRNLEAIGPQTFSSPNIRLPDAFDAAFGSLDTDAIPDLALAEWDAVTIWEFESYEMDLEFASLQAIPLDLGVEGQPHAVAWGDYDGDDDDDLVVGAANLYFYRNDAGVLMPDGSMPLTFGDSQLELIDLNHDDRLDIVVATGTPSTSARVYVQEIDGFPSSPTWSSVISGRFGDFAIADFDRDGWLDIAFSLGALDFPAENRIYRNLMSGPAE